MKYSPLLCGALRYLCVGLYLLRGLVLPALADTPNFSVRPVRIDLDNDQRTASLTVSNGGDVARMVRVEVDAWSQVRGGDRYVSAADKVIVVPPVLSIDPGQEMTVRLGLRHPLTDVREQAYRVFVTEVLPKKFVRSNSVQIAFRMGVPVFANVESQAPAEGAASGLTWNARLTGRNRVHVVLANGGNRHFSLSGAHLYADASQRQIVAEPKVPHYLLAGAQSSFDIAASKNLVLPTLVISGTGANGPFNAVVPVTAKAAFSASP